MAGNISRSNDLKFGKGWFLSLITIIAVVFLLFPLIVLIIFSFNKSRTVGTWLGFSLNWYHEAFTDYSFWDALKNSFMIAFINSLVSTILGTMAAIAIAKYTFRAKKLLWNVLYIPMILPEIIFGISLLILFALIRLPLGYVSVITAHITFSISFVALLVLTRMNYFDKSLEEASLDLGATRFQTFRYVILPFLSPAIIASALFSFTLSFDDFVITFFTTGIRSTTLPLKIYSIVKYGVTPKLNAISTLMIAFTLFMIIIFYLVQKSERIMKNGVKILIVLFLIMFIGFGLIEYGQIGNEYLYLVNWAGYMDETIIQDFIRETGINVIVSHFNDNEEILSKIQMGGLRFDIAVVSDYMVEIMIKEGLLKQIDHSLLPNYEYIDERFKKLAFDPTGHYYIPYTYGLTGIGYNSRLIKEEVDSWSILWDERFKKRIIMLDDMVEVVSAAMTSLGYSIRDRDPSQLNEALDILIAQKPLIIKYESNMIEEMLSSEEAVIAHTWSGVIFRLAQEQPHFKFVVPKEGAIFWVDNLIITSRSENTENAYKFINYLLRPDISARNLEYIQYAMPNIGALDYIDENFLNDKSLFPDLEDIDKFIFIGDLEEFMQQIEKAWTVLMSK